MAASLQASLCQWINLTDEPAVKLNQGGELVLEYGWHIYHGIMTILEFVPRTF